MKGALCLLVVVALVQDGPTEGSMDQAMFDVMCRLFKGDIISCPATSCKEIADTKPWQSRSGKHWLTGNTLFKACCANSIPPSQSQGWMRVGYVSSRHGCPNGLKPVTAGGKQLCAKILNIGCSSVIFRTHGVSYTKVCGRVYGYQKGSLDGFQRHGNCPGCTIDNQYVDGVSITTNSPRQHIWTLAASQHEVSCPCSNTPYVPGFVGQDYFCDYENSNTYNIADRLWDGSGCQSTNLQCCEGPWFCKDLPQATSNNIEFRLCTDEGRGNEDVYIEYVELYTQ